MSLVERLGYKTLNELFSYMDNNEIMEWYAYDLTQSRDWRKEYNKQILLEKQKNQTFEEEADLIKEMFMTLGTKK